VTSAISIQTSNNIPLQDNRMLDQTATNTTTNDQIKHGCQTCAVSFESREEQRSHMREDWQYVAPSGPSNIS
jgi:hypothetical protein